MALELSTSARQRRTPAHASSDTLGAAAARNERWQDHARTSFEAAWRSAGFDTVRLLQARQLHPAREFARHSSLAVALRRFGGAQPGTSGPLAQAWVTR